MILSLCCCCCCADDKKNELDFETIVTVVTDASDAMSPLFLVVVVVAQFANQLKLNLRIFSHSRALSRSLVLFLSFVLCVL